MYRNQRSTAEISVKNISIIQRVANVQNLNIISFMLYSFAGNRSLPHMSLVNSGIKFTTHRNIDSRMLDGRMHVIHEIYLYSAFIKQNIHTTNSNKLNEIFKLHIYRNKNYNDSKLQFEVRRNLSEYKCYLTWYYILYMFVSLMLSMLALKLHLVWYQLPNLIHKDLL